MFFKNIHAARLKQGITRDLFEATLVNHQFTPCEPSQASSAGWFPPPGSKSLDLVHTIMGNDGQERNMICIKLEEKILPSSVVNDALNDRCDEIEASQGKRPAGKLKQSLKDDIIVSLLPKAFSKYSFIYLYVNNSDRTIIIDTASSNKAEEVIALLRQSLEGLSARLIKTERSVGSMMTYWVQERDHPSIVRINDECELVELSDEKAAVIRTKNQDLSVDEIINHIDSGKVVSKLAVTWADHFDMVIKDDFSFNRLKFSDELLDQRNECGDAVSMMNVDFLLMSTEISLMIAHLIKMLGGEVKENADFSTKV